MLGPEPAQVRAGPAGHAAEHRGQVVAVEEPVLAFALPFAAFSSAVASSLVVRASLVFCAAGVAPVPR